jgi:hypothetical protein
MYKKILLVTMIAGISSKASADNLYLKLGATMNVPLNNQLIVQKKNFDVKINC